jgi:uncharacterized protein
MQPHSDASIARSKRFPIQICTENSMKLSLATSIRDINGVQWDALAQGKVLLSQAFFRSLEASGTVGRGRHIRPRYLTLSSDDGRLIGAVPAMIKWGTLAEYGPEYRWLNEGLSQGLFSWPKFQAGLPLFPVLGPKLLCHPEEDRERINRFLVQGLRKLAFERFGTGVLDILHIDAETAARLAEDGWLISQELHSFWINEGYPDYPAYLDSIPHRKRYMVLRERRLLVEQGIEVRLLPGEAITPGLIDQYYRGHEKVCFRYGNHPWLPKATWIALLQAIPESLVLAAAFDGDKLIAGSLWIINGDSLCLRTWSAHREISGLVMELVCHQPIEFAIARQLACVDSGLFGVHKRHRGYADFPVFNAHRFRDERLRRLALQTLKQLGQHPWHASR